MIVTTVRFEVPGPPVAQGSMRAFTMKGGPRRVGMEASNAKPLGEYRARIAMAADGVGHPLIDGPVQLVCSFHFDRPKAHYRANGELKPSAPDYKTTTPDLDKLVRALLDGLTGVLLHDDRQVVWCQAQKVYGEQPRTYVELGAI